MGQCTAEHFCPFPNSVKHSANLGQSNSACSQALSGPSICLSALTLMICNLHPYSARHAARCLGRFAIQRGFLLTLMTACSISTTSPIFCSLFPMTISLLTCRTASPTSIHYAIWEPGTFRVSSLAAFCRHCSQKICLRSLRKVPLRRSKVGEAFALEKADSLSDNKSLSVTVYIPRAQFAPNDEPNALFLMSTDERGS